MKNTTNQHATVIARTALRTCSMRGYSPKIADMRRDINGHDAAIYRAYDRATLDTDNTPDEPLSDAADLIQVAALSIIEYGVQCPCIADAIAADQSYILPDSIRKAAYKAVNAYIYANAKKPALYNTYIEDMSHTEDGAEVIDPEYIRVTKYYDVHDWADYETTQSMLNELEPCISKYAYQILTYRLQGYSSNAIAEKMHVSKQAISNCLARIRVQALQLWPDETRAFKI